MGLTNRLEELRKVGGDQWLSILNTDQSKVSGCIGVGSENIKVTKTLFSLPSPHTSTCLKAALTQFGLFLKFLIIKYLVRTSFFGSGWGKAVVLYVMATHI